MKTMTAYAVILAAGMALAPMAASAADVPTIAFGGSALMGFNPGFGYSGGSIGGSTIITSVNGSNTPRNEGQSGVCDPRGCYLSFSTNAAYVGGGIYEGKGGGLTVFDSPDVATSKPLLTGTFAEPLTTNVSTGVAPTGAAAEVNGALKDVVIDKDLAAYYGVPKWGFGEFSIGGPARSFNPNFPKQGFYVLFPQGRVTFSPIPVPAALPLMLIALAGLGVIRLRRMHAAA